MLTPLASQPWNATLSLGEQSLTLFFLGFATLAFVAASLRAWVTRAEVGSRYRNVTVARLGILAITTVSYAFILISFLNGYDLVDGEFVPNAGAALAFIPRYIEWSVGVPLLAAELLAVCTLVGANARRVRAIAMTGAFLMILAGYIGGVVIDQGENPTALLAWAGVGAVFWICANVILIRAVRHSMPMLTPEAAVLLRRAAILLLAGWVVYPIVYLVPVFFGGGAWATAMQVVLSVTDVTVKIGFGTLIWQVAKLRTAEDVRAGDDVHPESIWISSIKLSDAGVAREIYLANEVPSHVRRAKPPVGVASPSWDSSPALDDHLG